MLAQFLLKVLPHALSSELHCSLEDIDMPAKIEAGKDINIPIAGVTHQIPYQIALESALSYLSNNTSSELDGFYPVAHLHRDQIEMQNGYYVASQLSDGDIADLAYNFWDDSFGDCFDSTQDFLVETYHPDIYYAPEALLEDKLTDLLRAFTLYPREFEPQFMLGFLKAEVTREDKPDETDRDLIRRFITAMEEANAVPECVDCAEVRSRLDYLDYCTSFVSVLLTTIESEYLPDVHRYEPNIRVLLDVHYKAGLTVEQALEKLMPKIKADLEENRQVLAQREYLNQRNQSIKRTQTLCDSIHDTLQKVDIVGDKDGITLNLLDDNANATNHKVTIEYHSGQVQVIIHDGVVQTSAHVIPIESSCS